MKNSTWKFLKAKIDKLLHHKKQELNKKPTNQTNTPVDFFLSSKIWSSFGLPEKNFHVFQPPRKLNKISKTGLIISKSYRKWTLLYSSDIIMKNRIRKQWDEYFSWSSKLTLFQVHKKMSWFSSLRGKTIKNEKWTLTCSSITMTKNWLQKDVLSIFLSRQIWSCFGLSKDFFLVFQPSGERIKISKTWVVLLESVENGKWHTVLSWQAIIEDKIMQ